MSAEPPREDRPWVRSLASGLRRVTRNEPGRPCIPRWSVTGEPDAWTGLIPQGESMESRPGTSVLPARSPPQRSRESRQQREAPPGHGRGGTLLTRLPSSNYSAAMEIAHRITVEPGQCGGRPCIRGTRFRVMDLLELLAAGASHEEILRDYPFLEPEDIRAALPAISMLRRGGGLG